MEGTGRGRAGSLPVSLHHVWCLQSVLVTSRIDKASPRGWKAGREEAVLFGEQS